MSWEPVADVFCPECGTGGVQVNESHDDYYLGELYRCSNGHHFHWQPQEAPARVYRRGPPSPFEEFLREMPCPAMPATSVLLEQLGKTPLAEPGTVRIPIIRTVV